MDAIDETGKNFFKQKNMHRTALCLVVLYIAFIMPGCGGPKTYPIEGTVTFDGKPVPKGMITFSPDAEKGNDGRPSVATIENGNYQIKPGPYGLLGGAYVVTVNGTDGVASEFQPDGNPLFKRYRLEHTFGETDKRFDIEVPEGRKLKK